MPGALPRDLIMELMGAAAAGGQSRGALDPTKLRAFLGGAGARNQNLDIGEYQAYLRRSMPREPGKGVSLKRPLDLGRIERTDIEGQVEFNPEKFRNPRGRFDELMALLESEAEKAGYDSVYVEQIMNKFLPDVLKRKGYTVDENHAMMNPTTPSMYKRLGRGVEPGRSYF